MKLLLEIWSSFCDNIVPNAEVAQLVERNLAKVEVESSRLFFRSSSFTLGSKCGGNDVMFLS